MPNKRGIYKNPEQRLQQCMSVCLNAVTVEFDVFLIKILTCT